MLGSLRKSVLLLMLGDTPHYNCDWTAETAEIGSDPDRRRCHSSRTKRNAVMKLMRVGGTLAILATRSM